MGNLSDPVLAKVDEQLQAAPATEAIAAAVAEQQVSFIEYKADLIYGPSDSGKTTNIGFASDYVLKRYGKLSRLITADGGGRVPGLAESGQLEVWAIGAWKNPLAAFKKAIRGCWPSRLDDPEAPILDPDAGTGEIYGLLAIEGLTSIGDTVLMNLKEDRAVLSQDPSFVYNLGGESFAGGNKAYYGFIQDQMFAWVAQSHLLPFEKVIWTGLESRGDDQDGQPVYGPSIAGKKAIAKASQWFRHTLHIDIINKPAKEVDAGGTKLTISETERVMFLRTHADPMTKINFPCKVRVPVAYKSEVPSYIIPPNIAVVYELVEKLDSRQAEASRSRMGEIDGVRERLLKAASIAKERAEKVAMTKRARATVSVAATPATFTPLTTAGPVGATAGAAPIVTPAAAAAPVAQPGQVPQIQQIKRPAAAK